MVSTGKHIIESYAHIINADKSVLNLNPTLANFGYQFLWIDASELERNFSDLLGVPKSDTRPLTIIIGREQHGISHELHNAIVHSSVLGQMFMHMEFPGIILLKKTNTFTIQDDVNDIITEHQSFAAFYPLVSDLLLQLRLFKAGEIRCAQLFHMTSVSRQISLRKTEISIGSAGTFTLTRDDTEALSRRLKIKYDANALTEMPVKNFNIVYDIPDARIRFITLMTCLESLFNLGKDQIAHTIARHLSIILSENKEQFGTNYTRIKKLYNLRKSIVHGSEYKGDLVDDYLDLLEKVRKAINYCNQPGLTKQQLFENCNVKGF